MYISYFLLNATQKAQAEAISATSPDAAVNPQQITGQFANNAGNGLGIGNIQGLWVLKAVLLIDARYEPFWEFLAPLPVYSFDTDIIFAPPDIP